VSSYLRAAVRRTAGQYRNPVHPGDFPDPTLIRVGPRDFFATTTSTDWAPQFPLLHSRDLVHWKSVGAVFQNRPEWSIGKHWAPDLSAHGGRYFLYYVGHKRGGSLSIAVATADRPAGPYVDHGPLVGQAAGSIDPMAFTDSDGTRYLLWKEDGNAVDRPTPVWAARLSPDGLHVVGEPVELLRNDCAWEGEVVEAPFVLQRGEWYYLFYSGNACCGDECAYAVGVARARSVLGPWEKYAANPILAGNSQWKCPGHGSIVIDDEGRSFLLYHAYARDAATFVGRQALLDEVTWQTDGWPAIQAGRGPSSRASVPFFRSSGSTTSGIVYDDFAGDVLGPEWQWPQFGRPGIAFERNAGGIRSLVLGVPTASHDPLAAVVGRSLRSGSFMATTTVMLDGAGQAGLAAYGDRKHALGIALRGERIIVWQRKSGVVNELASASAKRSRVYLRMIARGGTSFRFHYSADGKRWTALGPTLDGADLPPWDRGVRVALTVGGAPYARARFAFLRIVPFVKTPFGVPSAARAARLEAG